MRMRGTTKTTSHDPSQSPTGFLNGYALSVYNWVGTERFAVCNREFLPFTFFTY